MDGLTASPSSGPPASCLLLAWGNRSRGDDALGPLLLDRIQHWLEQQLPAYRQFVVCVEDQQLQIEHVLDLQGRQAVLFIDAAIGLSEPFETTAINPCRDSSFSSHALSPQALLQAYQDVLGTSPPSCQLLGLRAGQFSLDSAPSPRALADLDLAEAWLRGWVRQRVSTPGRTPPADDPAVQTGREPAARQPSASSEQETGPVAGGRSPPRTR